MRREWQARLRPGPLQLVPASLRGVREIDTTRLDLSYWLRGQESWRPPFLAEETANIRIHSRWHR